MRSRLSPTDRAHADDAAPRSTRSRSTRGARLRARCAAGHGHSRGVSHLGQPAVTVPPWLAAPFERGWAGVDLFFVLSGFLIGGQLFDAFGRSDSLVWTFWIRRWTRTVPLYATALFVYAVVKPIVFKYPFAGGFHWTYFFFLQNLFSLTDFGQSWSLCVEEQFYFFFPLAFLALASARRAGRVAPSVWLFPIALSIAARAWERHAILASGLSDVDAYQYAERWVRCNTLTHLDPIAAGVFLAATRSTWLSWTARSRAVIAGAGALLVIGSLAMTPMNLGGQAMLLWLYTALAAGFAAMLVGLHGMPAPRFGASVIRTVALLSYGAYVWNNLLTRVLSHGWRGPWIAGTAVFLAATFALAWITYRLVELPGMRLRQPLLAWLQRPAPELTGPGA